MRRVALLVAALLLPAGQVDAQSTQERIEKGNTAFEEAFNAGDAQAAAQFYTDDAVALPPGGAPVKGKEAIIAYFQEVMDAGIEGLDLESLEVVESGDFAVEVGTFSWAPPGGDPETGSLLVVLQRGGDGLWRVHRVMWNQDS